MVKEFSPIILFTYNRLSHTQKTVLSILKNLEAQNSDLYIFSDGPKNSKDYKIVQNVRNYLKSITGFNKIKIIERNENWGLANSIISGVSEILKLSNTVIVLEDDMLVSPYFLKFMNDALSFYKDEDSVVSIHGYIYPVRGELPETFFIRGADCWGWATWRRGWKIFNPNSKQLFTQLQLNKTSIKQFNFNNSYNYLGMLKDQIDRKIDSWAINWYASAFIENKLTLYPGRSLIKNIGLDSDGTHCNETLQFDVLLNKEAISINKIKIKESFLAKRKIIKYFNMISKK